LRNAGCYSGSQIVFHITAADSQKSSEDARGRMLLTFVVDSEVFAEDGDGDGVDEDLRMVEKLMDGAACCNSQGGSAGAAGLHEVSVRQS